MTYRRLLCAAIVPLAISLSTAPTWAQQNAPSQNQMQASAALDALIADIRASDMSFDPIRAAMDGDKRAARLLPDVSVQSTRKQSQALSGFTTRYNALPTSGLTKQEKLNYDLIGYVLSRRALMAGVDGSRIPFQNDSGFFSSLNYSVRLMRFDTPEDYAAYTDRLGQVPRYFDQHMNNMRRGIKDGITAPAEMMPGVITGIENLTAIAAEDHPLAAPFMNVNADFPEALRAEIKAKGLEMMEKAVMPAYRKTLAFMELDYLPKARKDIGLSSVKGGKAQYEKLVKYYTTLDISPDEVHALGLSEVARIRAEMDGVIKDAKFNGTFKEFLELLRTDEQFYAPTREQLLKEAAYIAYLTALSLCQQSWSRPIRRGAILAAMPSKARPAITSSTLITLSSAHYITCLRSLCMKACLDITIRSHWPQSKTTCLNFASSFTRMPLVKVGDFTQKNSVKRWAYTKRLMSNLAA